MIDANSLERAMAKLRKLSDADVNFAAPRHRQFPESFAKDAKRRPKPVVFQPPQAWWFCKCGVPRWETCRKCKRDVKQAQMYAQVIAAAITRPR